MKRPYLGVAALLMTVGTIGPVTAQPYTLPNNAPPPDPAMSYRIIRVIPESSPSLSDTRRDSVGADPSCGAANPQGDIPTATTWGECP
jgi:hypothetical protein